MAAGMNWLTSQPTWCPRLTQTQRSLVEHRLDVAESVPWSDVETVLVGHGDTWALAWTPGTRSVLRLGAK